VAIVAAFDLRKYIFATYESRDVARADDLTNAGDNARTRLHAGWGKRVTMAFTDLVSLTARPLEAVIVEARLNRMTVFHAHLTIIKFTWITLVSIATGRHDPSKQGHDSDF
jgi:hypothetical protein